jgi:hypothetical protein
LDDVGEVTVRLIVGAGTKIGSLSTAQPAIRLGTFPTGLEIIIENNGRIQGAGGKGHDGGALAAGDPGGPALLCGQAFTLEGSGDLWGGGGGGVGTSVGGAGGGGAGNVPGLGGAGSSPFFRDGSPGTETAGGAHGASGGTDGGGPGLPGVTLPPAPFQPAVPGGAAGASIDGASYMTNSSTCDVRGPQIN